MDFFRYHGAWSPGVRLFRRCGFAVKAAVISAMFLVPMALLGWNYFSDKAVAIEFSAKERLGVDYARALMPALGVVLASGASPVDIRTALAQVQDRLGAELGTAAAHADVMKAAATGEPAAIASTLVSLLGQAADGSNLTLDPDIDSYYVMDAVMFRAGPMHELVARMRQAAAAASGAGPSAEQARRDFGAAAAVFAYHHDNVRSGMAKVRSANASVVAALNANAWLEAGSALSGTASQALRGGDDAAAAWAVFDQAASAFLREHPSVATRLLDALDSLLMARVAGLDRQRWVVAVTVVVSLLLAAYLFSAFFEVTRGGLREVRRHLMAMTDGDLTTHPRPWGRDEAAELMHSLSDMQQSLRSIVTQVRAASHNLVDSSTEIAGGAINLHNRTEQAAANLQQSASAMEQVASVVQNTAGGAREAASIAQANAEVAANGGRVIESVVETMRAIHASSAKIGEIIATVDSIAFQTNILALNAAVESARAGEAGRGFAVVASEVRALSLRTAQAASQISGLITQSTEQVRQGQQVVEQAGRAIGQVVGNAHRINGLLSQIAVGASEQAAGVTQTTRSVQELDTLTQANSALVEQTAAAAASLKEQAGELAVRVAAFRLPATVVAG
ncbi:MAG: HAMP domain-containing protein [Rubrivivax sp.]|nr:HAMP domain-containing protein [Rubrivivax sp.]